jgi:hypothetical protein
MSDPERWMIGWTAKVCIPDGEWIKYEDYANLKAEHDRLRKIVEREDGEMVYYKDYAVLQSENERLRKAGDAMENALKCSGCSECEGMYDCHDEAIDGWKAAKGVQS